MLSYKDIGMEDDDNQRFRHWLLLARGISDPCQKCGGMGVYRYGSTATWRGGIGGQVITTDVCDLCWGTGDAARHGTDLRFMMGMIDSLRDLFVDARRVRDKLFGEGAHKTSTYYRDLERSLSRAKAALDKVFVKL